MNISPSRILVLRPGAIGDVILTVPTFLSIRKRYAHAVLALAVPRRMHELLRGAADELIDIDSPDLIPLFSAQVDGPPSYDVIVSFFSKGFTPNLKWVALYRIEPAPATTSGTHITDYYLKGLEVFIPEPDIRVPELTISQETIRTSTRILEESGISPDDEFITVHPGSGSAAKNMNPEKLAEFIARIWSRAPRTKFLIIEGEADAGPVRELLDSLSLRGRHGVRIPDRNIIIFKNGPLHLLAGALKKSLFHVGNDSGITHLSAAVGTPTAAVFRSTDPSVYGPRGENVYILQDSDDLPENLFAAMISSR